MEKLSTTLSGRQGQGFARSRGQSRRDGHWRSGWIDQWLWQPRYQWRCPRRYNRFTMNKKENDSWKKLVFVPSSPLDCRPFPYNYMLESRFLFALRLLFICFLLRVQAKTRWRASWEKRCASCAGSWQGRRITRKRRDTSRERGANAATYWSLWARKKVT